MKQPSTFEEEIAEKTLKSSTSILGIVCRDGIVMAGDRRVTAGGRIVVKKDEQKVQQINDYLITSWTGGAADAFLSAKIIAAELRLKELRTRSRPTIREAAHFIGMMLYRNIRVPSMIPYIVGILVGGINEDSSYELYSIEPAGGVSKIEDFDANFSSGMPYILGLLERQYRKDISVKEAIELSKEAIKSAIERDPGSGNGIDVFTITKEGIKHAIAEKVLPQYR